MSAYICQYLGRGRLRMGLVQTVRHTNLHLSRDMTMPASSSPNRSRSRHHRACKPRMQPAPSTTACTTPSLSTDLPSSSLKLRLTGWGSGEDQVGATTKESCFTNALRTRDTSSDFVPKSRIDGNIVSSGTLERRTLRDRH